MTTIPSMTPPRPAPGSRAAPQPACPDSLLDLDEPPAFDLVNGEASRPVLLVCDHAGRRIPRVLGDLGLDRADLHRHIAWDIGADLVTRHLAARLDACAVLGTYSRLVIDCNRAPGSPESIPPVSDGTPVPGNQDLDEAAEDARLAAIFEPYHAEITRRLHHLWRVSGRPPALVSIHSFTPTMRAGGAPRPWHVGILWDHDGRIARPLMDTLERERGVIVGDNEPYSGWVVGYTVGAHGGSAGLPRVAVEIRQDQVATDAGATAWADRLARALEPILADPALNTVEHRLPSDGQE